MTGKRVYATTAAKIWKTKIDAVGLEINSDTDIWCTDDERMENGQILILLALTTQLSGTKVSRDVQVVKLM